MTIAEMQAELAVYIAARDKILLGGVSVKIGEMAITRANLETLEAKISQLRTDIYRATKGATVRFPRAPYNR